MTETHVKGLAELQKFLDQLPAKLEANVMRSAMRAGANVISAHAKANAPIGNPSSEGAKKYGGYRGALRDSIRVSTRSRRGQVTATVKAGGKNSKGADVYYVHFLEFGTAAHFISAKVRGKNVAGRLNRMGKKSGGVLNIGGNLVGSVMHPGIAPRPFMRPALDARAQDALVAVGEAIKKRLTKQGINTADVEIRAA